MPKKDKESPTSKCPNCGRPITSGQLACQCGLLLKPLARIGVPAGPPRLPYQSIKGRTDTPQQISKPKEDREAELFRLNKGAAKATIVAAIVLTITMVAAIVAAIMATRDYQAARTEYEARTRPYLFIQDLEFNKASENTTYLLIHMTNFGDRPARNVEIDKNISLCAVSPEKCTIIQAVADESQENTIVYPGRLRTIRIIIEENDYQKILITDILAVKLYYNYGNEEYWYEANLRLQQDNNIWHIEQEQGN